MPLKHKLDSIHTLLPAKLPMHQQYRQNYIPELTFHGTWQVLTSHLFP